MLVLALSLGLASGAGRIVTHLGHPPLVTQLTQGALMLLLVVAAVSLLRRRVDRRPIHTLGLSGHRVQGLMLGIGVALATGAVTWFSAIALGAANVRSVDLVVLGEFLMLNTLLLTCFEAIPEELALRGYAWTNLGDGLGERWASAITTALFVVGALLAPPVSDWVARLAGAPAAPPRGDLVVYVVHLVLFGFALAAARRTGPDGLLAAIGFHLGQLTVTRLVMGGLDWLPAGVEVDLTSPEAAILVWVHIVLGWAAFLFIRQRRGRSSRLEVVIT
ncbi:type II CAAX prenyl endopeptidase Rce1 family protein [Luteococcus sp. OSA5]|uniref:CPBP family glutamic-type intramembrane protease n=1 Tax=Luteococcus sp. OSA5 TaxID=3401630 RepID=UPI003B433F7E